MAEESKDDDIQARIRTIHRLHDAFMSDDYEVEVSMEGGDVVVKVFRKKDTGEAGAGAGAGAGVAAATGVSAPATAATAEAVPVPVPAIPEAAASASTSAETTEAGAVPAPVETAEAPTETVSDLPKDPLGEGEEETVGSGPRAPSTTSSLASLNEQAEDITIEDYTPMTQNNYQAVFLDIRENRQINDDTITSISENQGDLDTALAGSSENSKSIQIELYKLKTQLDLLQLIVQFYNTYRTTPKSSTLKDMFSGIQTFIQTPKDIETEIGTFVSATKMSPKIAKMATVLTFTNARNEALSNDIVINLLDLLNKGILKNPFTKLITYLRELKKQIEEHRAKTSTVETVASGAAAGGAGAGAGAGATSTTPKKPWYRFGFGGGRRPKRNPLRQTRKLRKSNK
jgi:hypothetical protein